MHPARRKRSGAGRLKILAMVALVAAATALWAQDATPSNSPAPTMPPGELVRSTVANEVKAADAIGILHMFRSCKKTPRGSQTHLYVETRDAMAGLLIAVNDKPLTPQQVQSETNHLAWLESNPDQLRKKQAAEKRDADRTLEIVKALPDAFRYQYAGTENSAPGLGKPGDQLVRLKFTPNSSFSPPSHVEAVLEGMEGYLLIDTTCRRIARIDGTLFKDVTFGWGLVGRLDKGGHFVVQQADLGDGSWDITEMKLQITGKIFLFKSISMISDEEFSDFRRVPDDLTFPRGVEMLKAEERKLAQDEAGSNKAER